MKSEKNKALMSKTMTLYVRYTYWYSLTEALWKTALKWPVKTVVCRLHWRTGNTSGRQFFFSYCSWAPYKCEFSSRTRFTESTPNENEQHKQHKFEAGNGRSERMRRRFAAVSSCIPSQWKVFFARSDWLLKLGRVWMDISVYYGAIM